MSDEVKNEEKIKVVIHGKVYWFDKNISSVFYFNKKDNTKINAIFFRTPQKISFKIGDIVNKDVEAMSLNFDKNGNINSISLSTDSPQKISFKIGDIENKDVYAKSLNFYKNGNIQSISLSTDSPQKISFKIGDIVNKDVYASSVHFHTNGNISNIHFLPIDSLQKISFKIGDIENKDVYARSPLIFHANGNISNISFDTDSPQKISFKIGDIDYEVFSNWIRLNDNTLLENITIIQDIEDYFYYKKKKYKLSFKSGDNIIFDAMGNLQDWCITNSQTRMQQIEEQDRLYKLEEEQKKLHESQNLATKEDWKFVYRSGAFGLCCVIVALGWRFVEPICLLLLNWICPECFDYGFLFLNQENQTLNPLHETFNKYTFFYEILKRTPIIILVILGFKFLQLAFERLKLIGEVEKVQKYLKLAQGDNVKNNLLGIIAVPFFTHKKQKQPLLDRLVDKINIDLIKKCNNDSGDDDKSNKREN